MQADQETQKRGFGTNGLDDTASSTYEAPKRGTAPGITENQDWTIEETAKALRLTRGAVIRRLEDGILPGYKVKRGHSSVWRVQPVWLNKRPLASVEEASSQTIEPSTAVEESAQVNTAEFNENQQYEMGTDSIDFHPSSENFDPAVMEDSLATSGFDPAAVQYESSYSVSFGEAESEPTVFNYGSNTYSESQEYAEPSAYSEPIAYSEPNAHSAQNNDYVEVCDEGFDEGNNYTDTSIGQLTELIELRTKLAMSESLNRAANDKIEIANYKIGYLEAKLEASQQQLKLLTDSSSNKTLWQKIKSFFQGRE